MGTLAKAAGSVHRALVRDRRARVLAGLIAERIPEGAHVLDVGAGDGRIAALLRSQRPDLRVDACDVHPRPDAVIEITRVAPGALPYAPRSFDYALLVDVLHHTDDPTATMASVLRVARRGLVIKDHLRDGFLAGPTLRLMDWIGNRDRGVALPYHYLSRAEWDQAWTQLALEPAALTTQVPIHAPLLRWIFGRSLHFVARLDHRS